MFVDIFPGSCSGSAEDFCFPNWFELHLPGEQRGLPGAGLEVRNPRSSATGAGGSPPWVRWIELHHWHLKHDWLVVTGTSCILMGVMMIYDGYIYSIFFSEMGLSSNKHWLVVSNIFYFPFHIWDVILPIDELHHFSRWLLHHQPDEDLALDGQLKKKGNVGQHQPHEEFRGYRYSLLLFVGI